MPTSCVKASLNKGSRIRAAYLIFDPLLFVPHVAVDVTKIQKEIKNSKLKTLHKLAVGLDMTVSELLDFPEMNETAFEDEY